jgi:hypothetical protein
MMDTTTLGYVLAAIGGIGGAALATGGRAAGGGGAAGYVGDDQVLPKVPWWLCRICPIVFGLLVSSILWAVIGEKAMGVPTPQPAMIFLPALLFGTIVGSAAAGVHQSLAPRGL